MHKFEPLNSTGKLDDLLIVPNIPLIVSTSRTFQKNNIYNTLFLKHFLL